MTTQILNSKFKVFDLNGEPLAAGKIYTYEVATTTNKVTYQDEDNLVANTNPIILDSKGEATIWVSGDTRLYITDPDDAEIDDFVGYDSGVTDNPIISSPVGAVLRSAATETGYIKIRLPMAEWPDTRMMFDVLIYDESSSGSVRLNLSGYANPTGTTWDKVTAITNSDDDLAVQFGNDGSYPAIYIGGVATQWIKPQIAVVDFLAGQVSYDSTTWNNNWLITITTSLGTITDSATATGFNTGAYTTVGTAATVDTGDGDAETPLGSDINGAWQNATLETGWSAVVDPAYPANVRYKLHANGKYITISGACSTDGTGTTVAFILPSGYIPTYTQSLPITTGSGVISFSINITTGQVTITVASGVVIYFAHTIPLD